MGHCPKGKCVMAQHTQPAEDRAVAQSNLRVMKEMFREQAEPVQEPVAWMCPEDPERETAFNWKAGHCENCGKQRIPLYTAPPQRKPLTDQEIDRIRADCVLTPHEYRDRAYGWALHFARAIERAHGIGGQE